MSKKKIILIILLAGTIIASGTVVVKSTNISKNITLMSYQTAKNVNTAGFQVDKYDKTNISGLINNNEVLTLTDKDIPEKTAAGEENFYCSIYNLNTKNIKDFKEVNIGDFYGLSPDKKYALYMEPSYLSKKTPEEEKQVQIRGKLYRGLKVLNLSTGQVNTLIPDHSNGEFKWISNDKVWASFFTGWQIIGVDGKVYASGDYPVEGTDSAWTVGTDIKDLGNTVEGKIYYSVQKTKTLNLTIYTMDIKTKEVKDVFSNNNSLHATKQGNTIEMSNYTDHVEKSTGEYNRTFSTIIYDLSGKVIRNIELPNYYEQDDFVLSPDGSKAAYIEHDIVKNNTTNTADVDINKEFPCTLKIFDIKTGSSKDIIKCPDIANISWNNTSDSLSFTSGRQFIIEKSTNDKGRIQFSSTRNENLNSYVVTFDK